VYAVTFIKDNQYMVKNEKRRVYNRHELLKISGSEGKEGSFQEQMISRAGAVCVVVGSNFGSSLSH
jgi:hypothetical protein